MSRIVDLTGMRFDRLFVTGIGGRRKRKLLWHCICDCGNECIVLGDSLKRGITKSCGCKRLEHGHAIKGALSPEYITWQNMKKRCYDENHNAYHRYGGRGIKVCDRWLESFEDFLEDMGNKPSPNHSIERIDVNEDYEPGNCKWATGTEQTINQRIRNDNTSGVKGVSWKNGFNKWVAYIKPNKERKVIHLGSFDNLQDAIEARRNAEMKYWNKQPS